MHVRFVRENTNEYVEYVSSFRMFVAVFIDVFSSSKSYSLMHPRWHLEAKWLKFLMLEIDENGKGKPKRR